MMRWQQFSVRRTVDPVAPARAIGYDIANTVALLFDTIVHEYGDPSRADLDTLRVQLTGGAVKASVYVETEMFDRLNPTL